MKKKFYFFTAFLLALATAGSAQSNLRMVMDSVTHQYKVIGTPAAPSSLRTAATDVTIEVKPHAARPESMIDIHISFGPGVNIDEVFSINLSIRPYCGENCIPPGFADIWLSTKAVNKAARTAAVTMGGMQPDKEYLLATAVFGPGGSACSGDGFILNTFRTGKAAGVRQKKMLLVINEEWSSTPAIQEKLDEYIEDISFTNPNLTVEKFYIESNSFDRNRLYEHIKDNFLTQNIEYLFFIGANGSTRSTRNLLDDAGNISASFSSKTFAHYTHPLYKHYIYNADYDELRTYKYWNSCFYPPEEVREAVFQQMNPLISMGMIIPGVHLTPQEKVSYVTDYFTKLHRFRKKEITFDRNVLLTDGFVSEAGAVTKALANGRWGSANTVAFGWPKDPNFSGSDPVWKADYLDKLGNQSFELLSLNLHGAPDYQSFGIYKEDIDNLPSLNTQLISLMSCNIGNYEWGNYLGGEYLRKGNVINVHAYADLLLVFTSDGASGLEYEYGPNGAFTLMSQGYTFSDAYRHAAGYIESEVLLGDPLATLRDSDPLPVVLKDFIVAPEESTAKLTWATTSESNSAHFTIERSRNGKKWMQIGKVFSKGESTSEWGYTFTDNQPHPGQNLYRLKMVDRDSTFVYSRIRSVNFDGISQAVYPNPAADKIYFDETLRESIQSVSLSDLSGKVMVKIVTNLKDGISVQTLTPGLYMMRISKIDGSTDVKKVLIAR